MWAPGLARALRRAEILAKAEGQAYAESRVPDPEPRIYCAILICTTLSDWIGSPPTVAGL